MLCYTYRELLLAMYAWDPAKRAVISKPSRSAVLLVSLPLRLLRRSHQRMYLLHAGDQPLSEACPFGGLRAGFGPLLDRVDIHVEAPRVEYEKLSDDRFGEPSAAIRVRVEAARQRQRFAESERLLCNADMGPAEVREYCQLDDAGKGLLRAAMQQLHLSAQAYHRILKLARTTAALAGYERIETAHLAEAIQYRPRR